MDRQRRVEHVVSFRTLARRVLQSSMVRQGMTMSRTAGCLLLLWALSGMHGHALDLGNVSLYAPFDKDTKAVICRSPGTALEVAGKTRHVKGKQGGALELGAGAKVSYALARNWPEKDKTVVFWLSGADLRIPRFAKDKWNLCVHVREKDKRAFYVNSKEVPVSVFDQMIGTEEALVIQNRLSPSPVAIDEFTVFDAAAVQSQIACMRAIGPVAYARQGESQEEAEQVDTESTVEKGILGMLDESDENATDLQLEDNRAGEEDLDAASTLEGVKALQPKMRFYPTTDVLRVQVKLPRDQEIGGLGVVVTALERGRIAGKTALVAEEGGRVAQARMAFPDLPDGFYQVAYHREGDKPIAKPDYFEKKAYDWQDNDLGKADRLLPPWTPVELEKQEEGRFRLKAWGRTYSFAHGLPVSIETVGGELLAGPVQWTMHSSEGPGRLELEDVSFASVSDAEVRFKGRGRFGPWAVELQGQFEFDGMLYYRCRFASPKPFALHSLTLDIPVRGDRSKLMHYTCARDYWFPAEEPLQLKFMPYVWAGDDEGGIQWFAESDQNWSLGNPTDAIHLYKDNEAGHVLINMVKDASPEYDDFTICFGLMATPVRPRPPRWRAMGFGHPKWRLGDEAFHRLGLDYSHWSTAPGWLVPNAHEPKAYNPDKPSQWFPFTSGIFWGIRPYGCSQTKHRFDEWWHFKDEWELVPIDPRRHTKDEGGWATSSINPSKSFRDFYAYQVDTFFRNYNAGGLYIDGQAGNFPSANLEAGFGYVGRDGRAHKTYPILAGRELLKRTYALVKKHRPDKGVIVCHSAAWRLMPVLSFCDSIFDGEIVCWTDLTEKIHEAGGWYSAAFSPDWMRSNFSLKPFGPVPSFDARLHTAFSGAKKKALMPTPQERPQLYARHLFGLLLLHDIHSCGGWTLGYGPVLAIPLEWWGIYDQGVAFHPYWKEDPAAFVAITPHDDKWGNRLRASVYVNGREKKALVVAMNFSGYSLNHARYRKEGRYGSYIQLDHERLGIPVDGLRITDAETLGKVDIPMVEGRIAASLGVKAFRMISIEWE